MLQRFPLKDVQKKMIQSPEILKMLMNPEGSDDSDYSDVLHSMAKDKEDISKQIIENLL